MRTGAALDKNDGAVVSRTVSIQSAGLVCGGSGLVPGIASRYFTSGLARSSTDPKYTTLPPFCATSTTHGGHTVSGELRR